MKKNVLIKYSLVFFVILIFCNCNKKLDLKKENKAPLKFKFENNFIVKNDDTISLSRKRVENNDKIDSVFLKIHDKKILVKIPMITNYNLGLKRKVPNDKRYDFSDEDFLITATYRDFVIQYQFNYRLYMLKNIYMITDIDEVYPDFNKKSTDSIAKIEVINVYQSKNLENYLNRFTNRVYNDNVKINRTYYIKRKEGIKQFIE